MSTGRVHVLRDESGFTLVEILVALGISLVVLLATLQTLDAFSWNAAHQTRVTDANEQVRATMDRTVRDLRGASVVVRADATDLVYAVPDSAGARVERLCVADGELYGSSDVTAAAPAAPAAACSDGAKLATLRSAGGTAFTYDGASSTASPALVKNVGLTFSLDTSLGTRVGASTLRASAARRSAGTLPITDADLDTTCDGNQAMLSLSAALPGVSGLTVTYASDGGIALGSASGTNPLTIPAGITKVVATVTDALGVTNTIERDVECSA